MKSFRDFPRCLYEEPSLNISVERFYKERYFDPYCGDDMPRQLAIEMFDTSVNMGVERTIGFLQRALNVLNRNELLYPDMVEDGDFGPTTYKHLHSYLDMDEEIILVKVINVLQGNHYLDYMRKSPKQEKYARGWLKRVTLKK